MFVQSGFLTPWTLSALAVHLSVLIATVVKGVFLCLAIGGRHLPPPLSSILGASSLPAIIQNSARHMLNTSASLSTQDHVLHHVVALDLVVKTQVDCVVKTQACAVWLFSTLLLSSKGKFHAESSARLHVSR